MNTLENLALLDDIRRDANLLVKSRGIDYPEAYDIAKKNLIGNKLVTDYKSPALEVVIDDSINTYESTNLSVEDNYNHYQREILKIVPDINVKEYSDDQLRSYIVAQKMGLNIMNFLSNRYSPEQINYLGILAATGENLDKYKNNFSFIPKENLDDDVFNSKAV